MSGDYSSAFIIYVVMEIAKCKTDRKLAKKTATLVDVVCWCCDLQQAKALLKLYCVVSGQEKMSWPRNVEISHIWDC